jgi:hypothetical protein
MQPSTRQFRLMMNRVVSTAAEAAPFRRMASVSGIRQ